MKHLRFGILISLFLISGIRPGNVALFAATDPIQNTPVNIRILDDTADLTHLTVAIPEFSVQNVEVETGNYDLISIGQEPTISREGWPDLPFISKNILIPPRSGVRVEINSLISHTEAGINPVIAPGEDGNEFVHLGEAVEFQNCSGFWPAQPVEIGEPVIVRGCRLTNVRFYPVQYNRTTGVTRFNEEIDVNLRYEGDGINVSNSNGPLRSSIYFHRLLENLVENPPPRPERDDLHCASYLYIVPEVNGVPEAVEPLLEWQRRKGHRVGVEYLDNRSNAGTIMNVIREYYNSDDPVEFVTIVGDVGAEIDLAASTRYGDYEYTTLDGNDPLPDIAIGRLSCANLAELNRIVNKLVSYESNPYMANTNWFKQGAVVAGHVGNGLGTVLLAKYVRRELLKLDYNEVRHWYHNEDGEIRNEQPFVTECFNWGISIFQYRAYLGMNNLNLGVIDNLPNTRGRWPAVVAISCMTGGFVRGYSHSEAFLRSRGGGIGAIGTATAGTNPRFNNIMAGGIWKGILKDKLFTMGWGLNSGKYELWRSYRGFEDRYMSFMDWNNLMGDPGTVLWTDIPVIISAEHPDNIQIGQNSVEIDILDEGEDPVNKALVCLYKADDDFQITKYTDHNGRVEFFIDPEETTEGDLLVTVSKHNHKPYLGSIEIVETNNFIGVSTWEIDDDEEGESRGDSDGIANPGEIIEITAQYSNFGDDVPEGNGTMVFESLSPYAEVISEPIEFEQALEPGEFDDALLIIDVNPACMNQTMIPISVLVNIGDLEYRSLIRLQVQAPHILCEEVIIEGETFNRGEPGVFNVGIRNIGDKILQPSVATLVSEFEQISVDDSVLEYEAIEEGEICFSEHDLFRVNIHPFTIPGTVAPFLLIIQAEDGFIDSVRFNIEIGVKDEGDPLGPDEYGYVCYDSRDEDWDLAPVYEWVEIDPNEENVNFRGTELDLRDQGDNQDVSQVVELPFQFQYYGQIFDDITICSNGWAAFGDQEELSDFRNRRIGQALGPDAQLCVWWDNLVILDNQGSVLHHFDQEDQRYIIEWNSARRLISGGYGSSETFQIILYNPETYPTSTGDGMILFQYKDVENEASYARSDHPYCTIGISNPDDSDGIEYTYWNEYPDGAQPVQNQMSLLFITEFDFRSGILMGRIMDFETDEAIENVQIQVSNGYWAETDENGEYIIEDILVGDDYDVNVSILGWNDSTLTDFEIAEDETLEVDFSLLHPEFSPSANDFDGVLELGNSTEIEFELTNTGNGPLTWSVDRALRGDHNIESWVLRDQYLLGDITDDARILGAVYAGDRFFIVGSNERSPQIYIVNRDGELIDQRDQPGEEQSYGMKDLAFDGEWVWGGNANLIYALTPEGAQTAEFVGPFNPNNNLAWDSERELLWVSSTTSSIVGIDREGNVVDQLDRLGLRIYGLAYFPDDPDGCNLYIFSRLREVGDQLVHKMSTETNELLFVASLEPENGGTPNAAFITNEYDVYSWVFMAVINDGPNDRLDIHQLSTRRDWFWIEPESGELNPEETQDITLLLSAENLPVVVFEGDLIFTHNGTNGETILPVTLEIIDAGGGLEHRVLVINEGWNLVSLNITPQDQDIVTMMQPLVEGGNLELMKDGNGRFYWPGQDFNNIPEWNPLNAYQIKLTEGVEFNASGEVVQAGEVIPLSEGWNMKAYLPRESVHSEIALSGIVDRLIMAKDGNGHFYLPAFEFNNIGNMLEGQGYQIKVTEDVDLVYTVGDELASKQFVSADLEHFNTPKPQAFDMSILVLSEIVPSNLNCSNWELAVFNSDDLLLGVGKFNYNGKCGIAVWGDDPLTGLIEGALPAENMIFRLWNGKEERDVSIEPILGDLQWQPDGLLIGNLYMEEAVPLEFGIHTAYPNPFNSQVLLSYSIEEHGFTSISILDLTGREVASLVNQNTPTGNYSATWRADQMPSGLYVARLESLGRVNSMKLMLVK